MSKFSQTKKGAFRPKFNDSTAIDVAPANVAQDEIGQQTMRQRRERLAADPEYRRQQRLKVVFAAGRNGKRSKKAIRMPEFGFNKRDAE